jgi:hypothetical protein
MFTGRSPPTPNGGQARRERAVVPLRVIVRAEMLRDMNTLPSGPSRGGSREPALVDGSTPLAGPHRSGPLGQVTAPYRLPNKQSSTRIVGRVTLSCQADVPG